MEFDPEINQFKSLAGEELIQDLTLPTDSLNIKYFKVK